MEFESQLKEFELKYQELKKRGRIGQDIAPHCFVLSSQSKSSAPKDIDVMFIGLIHGNEVGGLAVINQLLQSFLNEDSPHQLRIAIALGNVAAGYKGTRFVEKDLNRIFGSKETHALEEKRARELEPLIRRCRFILDIHQTIEPTANPFFIFGFDPRSFAMARKVDPSLPIISYSIEERKENGIVLTGYAIHNDAVAITAELGQKGFYKDQIDHGIRLCKNTIEFVKAQSPSLLEQILGHSSRKLKPNINDTVLVFAYRHPNEGDTSNLLSGFTNFMQITRGQKIGTDSKGDILSPIDGKILFPKYGTAKNGSKELFVLLKEQPLKDYLKQNP